MFEEITAKHFKLKKNIKTTDPRNSENAQQAYIHTHTHRHIIFTAETQNKFKILKAAKVKETHSTLIR